MLKKFVGIFILLLLIINLTYEIGSSINEINSYERILYSPLNNTITYLINRNGEVTHTWLSNYNPGVSVWWLGNGSILRTIKVGNGNWTGGSGGGVQKVLWDGTVVWDFRYNTNGVMSHHDVKTLPNGNVLMIAWEAKTREEVIAAGRNTSCMYEIGLWPDHIIEVEPTGPTSGDIVWEWHSWDHLIQDFNCSQDNYGVVRNHPELIDINYVSVPPDIMHTNSIDYNEDFDQIMISVRHYNEIWVIDHSTTTEEAAGHTGGNSGKGGDLLYRWGNPEAYQRGTINDKKLFYQHDATWIDEGYPGEGNILIFNNGNDRPSGNYSSIDEITPPVYGDGKYYLKIGEAYGPKEQTWIYTADPPMSFYSMYVSGAHRLSSGNTLISAGANGYIFEVNMEGETVWQYNTSGPFFKAVYIPPGEEPIIPVPDLDCSGSLSWVNIEPGSIVTGSFDVQNIGESNSLLNWIINTSSISWGTWTYSPESEEGLTPEDGKVTVQVSVISPNEINKEFKGYIRIENQEDPEDFDVIPVYLKNPRQRTIDLLFFDFFENHPNLFLLLQKLLNRLG